MRKHITWALAVGLLLTASVAAAQTPQPPRQAGPRQLSQIGPRIRDGVRSGQLTRPELARLRERLTALRQRAKAMRGDGGTLAPEQRKQLRREWRQTSRMLFVMRHNRIKR